MRSHPLAAHLIDFSIQRHRPGIVATPSRNIDAEIAAARDAAYRDGFVAGRAAMETDCAVAFDRIDTRALHRLVEAREQWSDEIADLLSIRLNAQMSGGFDTIGRAVASVLSALAIAMKTPSTLDALATRLSEMLRDGPVIRIAVSGPEDMLAKLDARLEGLTIAARTIADTIDVRVQIDDTVLETQLGAWRAALADALGFA